MIGNKFETCGVGNLVIFYGQHVIHRTEPPKTENDPVRLRLLIT
jgi:hypothetical protein